MNRRHFFSIAATAGTAVSASRASQSSAAKFRVGVIGHTGKGDYGHGLDRMWLSLPETEIVAVADANPAGLMEARARLGNVAGYADFRQMLEETRPDVVVICPRLMMEHHAMTLAAIEAGARGIYIEKPFCPTLAEADDIVDAAEKSGARIALAHRNRFHPALAAVDRLLKEEAIGQLLELRGRGKEDGRGGCVDLWVLGSHVLNLVHYFAGRPLACSATLLQDGRPATREDVRDGGGDAGPIAGNALHARFEMESGVPAFFDSVQDAGSREAGFGLQLIGTQGIIDLRMDATPLAHLIPGNPFQPTGESRPWIPITSAGAGKPELIEDLRTQSNGHLLAGRELLAAIREERAPACDVLEGRMTVEMITAVLSSHCREGGRVSLPLERRDHPLANW